MEQNEIIEGNKLIAEFMGATPQRWYPESSVYDQTGVHYEYPKGSEYPTNQRHHSDQLLRYNNSWEWLMPVVDKIERIKFKGDDDGTDAIYNYAFLRTFSFDPQHGYLVRFNRFSLHESTSRIEAMWNAVVECIKSFNSDKNPEPSVATDAK